MLQMIVCIRSLYSPCIKQAFPRWLIEPIAPSISSGLQTRLAVSPRSVCNSSILFPQEAMLSPLPYLALNILQA